MAETEHDAQERTERATPRREEEARRQGQLPRSVELSTAAVVLSGAAGVNFFGAGIAEQIGGVMRACLTLSRDEALDAASMLPQFGAAVLATALACLPVFAIVVAAALFAPLALGGWNFSTEALGFKFDRLDPLAGVGRMFSPRSFVELGKALAKFAVVALLATWLLHRNAPAMLEIGREPVFAAIGHSVTLTAGALLWLAAALLLIAAVDVPWQLWQHAKQLRMSREEIREEMKETDGSPEVRSRIRQMQRELAKRRMMEEVPKADVIVVNPTHYAVALRYDEQRMRAPRVVAKGVDLVAARIRELAEEHGVPIFEAPPLARALHRSCDIGEEIPATLYVAVAQVLSYIFQLRTAKGSGAELPQPPIIDSL